MVEKPSVIEESDRDNQCGASENAENLRIGGAAKCKKHGNQKRKIDRESTEQRDGLHMDLARVGAVHKSEMKCERADGKRENAGSSERNQKGDGGSGDHSIFTGSSWSRHRLNFAAMICSRPRKCAFWRFRAARRLTQPILPL